MLITLTCPVRMSREGAEICDRNVLARIAGHRIADPGLAQHMDGVLIDQGFVDAGVELVLSSGGERLEAVTGFRAVTSPDQSAIVALADYLAGQLLDGWGEDGIALDRDEARYHAEFLVEAQSVPHRGLKIGLVDDGVPVPDRRPTPIVKTVEAGDLVAISALLAAGADPTVTNQWGQTPLDIACARGHAPIAHALLSAGALPSVRTVHLCAMNGDTGLLASVLDAGAEVDTPDISEATVGMTPLMWAANRSHIEAARLLISRAATLDAQDALGRTALMHANKPDLAELLLVVGADASVRDAQGLDASAHHRDQADNFRRIDADQMADAAIAVADAIDRWRAPIGSNRD